MRTNIRFPFHVVGRPRRCAGDKDIYCSFDTEVDIPEIGVIETEAVFSCEERYAISLREDGDGPFEHRARIHRAHIVRAYEGALYRRIGPADPVDFAHYAVPFPYVTAIQGAPESVAQVTHRTESAPDNPVCAALARQIEWDLERASASDSRVVQAWPAARRYAGGAVRNDAEFQTLRTSLESWNQDSFSHSLAMIEAQASRLLVIGREVWMKCPPPAWCVSMGQPGDAGQEVKVSVEHVFDGFDRQLDRLYFPLSRRDEMLDYVVRCERMSANGRQTKIDHWAEAFDADLPALEFDHVSREVNRAGLAMAAEIVRDARKLPSADLTSARSVGETVAAMVPVVRDVNLVLGGMPDMSAHIEALCEAWKARRRPGLMVRFGPDRKKTGDLFMKRAKALAEYAPIDVTAVAAPAAAARRP